MNAACQWNPKLEVSIHKLSLASTDIPLVKNITGVDDSNYNGAGCNLPNMEFTRNSFFILASEKIKYTF